jgi:hypothetical protein
MNEKPTIRAGEKVMILDRGHVELLFPRDWSFRPDPEGFAVLKDPGDSARLEVSCLTLPVLPPGTPPVEERLGQVMSQSGDAARHGPVTMVVRYGARLAWAEYEYDSDDAERGERRPARGRWLLGANEWVQVLMTYCYWVADASWAVPAWTRFVETLRLGDGVPLETPKDHWSLRQRKSSTD